MRLTLSSAESDAKLPPDSIALLATIFCGCGNSEEVWEWVHSYLEMLHGRVDGERPAWMPESGPEYLAAYVLDHIGLTEHGISIHYPWLTTSGIEALAFLNEHGVDWRESGRWVDSAGCVRSNSD